MNRVEFRKFVDIIVDIYGVDSYLKNLTGNPEVDEDEFDNPWFCCPECGEPILWEDYGVEMEDLFTDDGTFTCPICEETMDL